MRADFSPETMQARRQCSNVFESAERKKKNLSIQNSKIQRKEFSKRKDEIVTFSHKQNLN